jgi:hypothetical protein
MRRNSIFTFILAAAVTAVSARAGSLPIGVATAVGSYSVNDVAVSGNTDLADGTRLETTTAPSEVRLGGGTDLRLAARSVGAIYSDHLELEGGAVRVGHFENYGVDVRKLQVQAESPNSEAIVRLRGNTVEVASLGGSVRVSDGGVMLTHVASGTRMSFKQKSDATSAQTGASTGRPSVASDEHVLLWFIIVTAAAAITIGSIAAAQGKSPF